MASRPLRPATPSPCAPQSDGVRRLGPRAWLRLCLSGIAVGWLAGCAPAPMTGQFAGSTASRGTTAPAWNAVFQKWWQAATKPQTSSAVKPASHPVVYINIAVLAAHHPAWKLADALEHRGSQAAALAILHAPAAVAGLPSQVAPVPFGPLTVGAPGGVPDFYQATKTVTVRDLDELQSSAAQRQAGALHEFLADAATAQAQNRAAQALSLKSALADDIEVAQRLNLAALTPSLPSDPIQLEMTNLRLALLKNLYATPGEREQARQRLSALEAQWEAKLRSQEAQRLAELARLRQERPQRLRQEGEAHINETLSAITQQDTAAREAVSHAHDNLLAQDFDSETTRLGVVLPAAALPAQRLASASAPTAPRAQIPSEKLVETFSVKLTSRSVNTIPSYVWATNTAANVSAPPQAAMIRALRAQAWQDATRWAGLAARRAGWEWHGASSQSHSTAPDRTAAALRILNLS